MKALVTGSTGFIGSHLVDALVGREWSVRCLVHDNGNRPWLHGLSVECCTGDCCYSTSLREAVRGVDVIFHLAGTTKALDSQAYFEVNAVGTGNLMRAAVDYNPGIKAFVYVSSQAAAGPSGPAASTEADGCAPVSAYGRSKLQGESVVLGQSAKVPVVIIRPPVVYGPRDRGLLPLFKLLSWGVQPRIAGRGQRFSFCYVEDLVQGLVLASEREGARGETFFLSDGHDYGWNEIGEAFARAVGKRPRSLPIPKSFIRTYAAIADVTAAMRRRPGLINRDKAREMVQQSWVCDNGKSRRVLGFEPRVALVEGARLTFEWYKGAKWL